jgi:hypothetical protein
VRRDAAVAAARSEVAAELTHRTGPLTNDAEDEASLRAAVAKEGDA